MKGAKLMSIRSLITSISVACAAGWTAFSVSRKAEKQKKKLKTKAAKALRAIGEVIDDLKRMAMKA